MENQTKTTLEHGLKWGLIYGMANIAFFLIAYLIDKTLLVSMWFSGGIFIINLILLIFPVIAKRKEFKGLISFNDAFIICFTVFLGGALIQNIFTFFLYNFIDTGLAEFIKQQTIESTVSLLEKFNLEQDQIDKAISDIQSQDFTQTPARISLQFFYSMIYGGLISMILAAILKKAPKVSDFE